MNKRGFWLLVSSLGTIVVLLIIALNLQQPATPGVVATPPLTALAGEQELANPGPVEDRQVSAASFPETLAGYRRTQLVSGPDAAAQIQQMHQGNFQQGESYIAQYQGPGGEQAQVWVSLAALEAEARGLLEDMHNKIGSSPVFTNHQLFPLGPLMYHYVEGMGQEHFFYYRGDDVIWISLEQHELLPEFTSVL